MLKAAREKRGVSLRQISTATKISMAGLASQLSRSLGRMVQDRTGLQGFYNLTLRATNEVRQGPDPFGRTVVDPNKDAVEHG